MNEIIKSLANVWKSFRNVIRQFAQSNTNFVIIIIVGLFALIYKIAITNSKAIWVLAIINAFLCLINYAKTKNITETTLTLIIGLFTIFTVSWCNEFILIFVVSILFFTILSFIVSSIQISSIIESIITIASGYWQENMGYKEKYKILHELAQRPTKHHQLSLEERAIVVKEMIFDKVHIEKMDDAKEIIEGFKTVLGFEIDEAIANYRLLYNIYMVQKNRAFCFSDMEIIFNYILLSPFGPRVFFDILSSIKDKLLEKDEKIEDMLRNILTLADQYRDKDFIISKIKLA